MKKISTLIIIILAYCCSYGNNQDQVKLMISKNKMCLSFSKKATIKELKEVAARLLKKDISFGIEKITYNKDGSILYIKFSIDCHDGFKGSVAHTFNDTSEKNIGFYRIYHTNTSPFGMDVIN